MKATLEFNLPEEAEEHRLSCKASEIAGEIENAYLTIRNWGKHGREFKTVEEALEACREVVWDAVSIVRNE